MRICNSLRPQSQRGSALLVVLWLSAALAAIALSVSTTVRTETDHAATVSEGLRAHYMATGAVERAIQWMNWGTGERRPDGTVQFWEPGQSRMLMQFPAGEAVVEVIPETAKLNINYASPEDLLRVVMVVTGDAQRARDIVAGIVHWRSAAGAGDALDAYYLSLGPTFQPRHASFEEIEELLFVRGMTPELFYGNYISDSQGQLYARGGLRDCLSVWGAVNGPFDVNSMSPSLMESIGIPMGAVQAILARRAAQPFRNQQELAAFGVPLERLRIGGNTIWTLRATARLRRPDGTPS
ncbi:MAG: hypothetical protein ABI824_09685, partial [Acidobacteriota bacterium]